MKKIILLSLLSTITLPGYARIKRFNHPQQALKIAKPYLPNNPVIVECGAYDGVDSLEMIRQWPLATVYSFEPVPELYKKLVRTTKICQSIHTYELAIGDMIGTTKMYVSTLRRSPNEPSQSSSLLAPKTHLTHAPHVLFNNEITVDVTTFDEWAKQHNVDHVDMMWLDMQGYELHALKASPNILSTVQVILTEVEYDEAYQGQYQYREVKKWLEEQGFQMIAENKECSWFGDALFVRKQSSNN
jgi:2-O-methyltransferase